MEELLKKIGQLQYEISILDIDEETLTGVDIRTEELKEMIIQGQALPIDSVNVSFEYEMFINDKGTPFEMNTWIPISNDRIKDVSRIDEYIENGLLRKIVNKR